jgi:predicted component of type VI protein secretion system
MVDNSITKGTMYPIYSTTNTIGRATDHDNPDIAITDQIRTVSRLHGKISYNGSFFLQDLESTNKIISHGKKLDDRETIELLGGDTFVMGDIRLRLITDLTNSTQYR